MMRLVLALAVLLGSSAHAHPGHGNGTFAPIFNELMRENFFLRPAGRAGPADAFVLLLDGRRYALDSVFWDAVRRQAANVDVPIDEPPAERVRPWAKVEVESGLERERWGPYFAGVARSLKVKARRFTLDLVAATLDGFHRYGVAAAGLILTAEVVHHGIEYLTPGGQALIPISASLCQVVQAGCLYVASRTQEYAHVLTKPFPGATSMRERYDALRLSKRLRRARRRALKDVRDAGGNPVVFAPGDRELTDGADVLKHSCFRSALAQPDPDGVCQIDHSAGLRWQAPSAPPAPKTFGGAAGFGTGRGAFGAAPAKSRFSARAIEDRPDVHPLDFAIDHDQVERSWRTEDFVDFLYLKLDLAQLGAGDLRDQNARAFMRLRKQVSHMRRALDLYAYTLRLRAILRTARTADEIKTDVRFETAMTYFLRDFDRDLQAILTRTGSSNTVDAPFRANAKAAFQLVRDWIGTKSAACGATLSSRPAGV